MGRLLKVAIGVVIVGAVAGGAVWASYDGKAKKDAFTLVKVARGTIVDKALATGQIVPRQEIQVKSQISGRVKECFAEVGDRVEVGQPLFAIIPDPTPSELNEAERNVQLAQQTFDKARLDLERSQKLSDNGILSLEQHDATRKAFDQARIELDRSKERLALTKEGKILREKGGVDSVIRASAAGTVLQRHVNPGDPVVPLTSYQAGTPLMTMADMGTILFKGTVDEIDVGKLKEGLPVRIKIGALPDAQITGHLTRIAPKAVEKDGSTLFDVEVAIDNAGKTVLRAGYSANADIIIQEKSNILVLPERLITLEKDKAFVELPPKEPKTEPIKKQITVGLSDGLSTEVVAGLADGDSVVQRPPKEITGK
jgi:HlyD family secretion protein